MVNVKLLLDRLDRKYNPGDVINLEARVQLNSNTNIRSIYARIQGYAHVEWADRDSTYRSHESFFEQHRTLEGERSVGSEIPLPVGLHVYHASFVLPKNLPENHETKYGHAHIRYEAKVHVNVAWGFDSKERIPFYVRPQLDLNEFPNLCEPVRAAARKTFGCCCWESDPLHIYNVLPRSGFVPGDRIQFSLELNNDSDVAIDGATVKLVEKTVYRACDIPIENSRTLWRHEFSGNNRQLVSAMQNKVFSTNLHFDPSWNFRFFHGCGIITVQYYLTSTARTSGCHINLSNHTPIRMGTIPLRSLEATLPSAPLPNFQSAPPADPISEQPSASAPTIETAGTTDSKTPPPTFTGAELSSDQEQKQ